MVSEGPGQVSGHPGPLPHCDNCRMIDLARHLVASTLAVDTAADHSFFGVIPGFQVEKLVSYTENRRAGDRAVTIKDS